MSNYRLVQRSGAWVAEDRFGNAKCSPTTREHASALVDQLNDRLGGALLARASAAATQKTPAKPYGNVTYADPKNGKYPIDTQEHCRAAWSYINMPKNAGQYPMNGVSLGSVRHRILQAMKKFGIQVSKPTARSTSALDDSAPVVLSQLPTLGDCPECDGIGWNEAVGEQCPNCAGTGRVPRGTLNNLSGDLTAGPTQPSLTIERAFVIDGGSRTALFAPWETAAARSNPDFTYLQGRYVGADAPNRNLAYWSTKDLEMGQPSVAGGPLNWLHQEHQIIGAITGSRMVREAASAVGNHIEATAVAWPYLFPEQVRAVERASANRQLFLSMECTSNQVQCVDTPGRPGCGGTFSYADYMGRTQALCNHLRERSSVRRFIEPRFLGGAVVVPPAAPGWAHADATVLRQAAAAVEREGLTSMLSRQDAEGMLAAILQWAA